MLFFLKMMYSKENKKKQLNRKVKKMNLIEIRNDQPVTTSLQVAIDFEKQHKDVLKAIDTKIQSAENSAHYKSMFAEGEYKDSRDRKQRMYYMNRDGFTFIAMGFSGRKADQFKLKYIEAFNKMEQHIKQQLDTSTLSPELQFMNSVVQSLAKQELEAKRIEAKVDNITEIVSLNTTDWRKDSQRLIAKVAQSRDGGANYQLVRAEIYKETERRAKADLNRRVKNKQQRMALEGVGKSKINAVNKLDVIGDDSRLLEVFIAVVKDFAIKHGVTIEKQTA